MYRRILVPIDGSTTSQCGFDHALALAKSCGASVVLLHAIEFQPMMMEMASAGAWDLVSADLRDYGQGVLERAHRAAIEAGVANEARLEDAGGQRVCDVILDQARARQCDLIVMGTHGRRGLEHALVGSDAERVVRMSPVPVLLVRATAP